MNSLGISKVSEVLRRIRTISEKIKSRRNLWKSMFLSNDMFFNKY
jgi:hypothetical protein